MKGEPLPRSLSCKSSGPLFFLLEDAIPPTRVLGSLLQAGHRYWRVKTTVRVRLGEENPPKQREAYLQILPRPECHPNLNPTEILLYTRVGRQSQHPPAAILAQSRCRVLTRSPRQDDLFESNFTMKIVCGSENIGKPSQQTPKVMVPAPLLLARYLLLHSNPQLRQLPLCL
jgi:hypothetical protein